MNIEEQLRRDEGYRAKLYQDTVGKWTIGYGRNLQDMGILASEASLMLENDIAVTTMRINALYPWFAGLDDARQGVLVNMGFNMGVEGLILFKDMLAKVQAGEYEEAADAMLDSLWAKQVGDRAVRLSKQMLTGEWV